MNRDSKIPADYDVSDNVKAKIPFFQSVQQRLEIKRVSSAASLMHNHWILDGTYEIRDPESESGKTAEALMNLYPDACKNKPLKQHYDAMIGEAAINNHCILVVDDGKFRNHVENAITTSELVSRANLELKARDENLQ